MKLFFSERSPYVRKVLVCAHEAGIFDDIELLTSNAHPIKRDASIVAHNPLGEVPTLLLDEQTMLADSGVICGYMDELGLGKLFPKAGPLRWVVAVEHALGDGLIEAALSARYEMARPKKKQWDVWYDAKLDKIHTTLAHFENRAKSFEDRFDIGLITVACALSYLNFRFSVLEWEERYPVLAEWYAEISGRDSMRATSLT